MVVLLVRPECHVSVYDINPCVGHGLLELSGRPMKFYYLNHLYHSCFTFMKNVSGRTLVGLRFWNQVRKPCPSSPCCISSNHSSGWWGRRKLLGIRKPRRTFSSHSIRPTWVTMSYQPSRPANPVDSKWVSSNRFISMAHLLCAGCFGCATARSD